MKEISKDSFYELSEEDANKFTGIVRYSNTEVVYFENGKWHRIDGPAHVMTDDVCSYWIHDVKTTKEGMELYFSLLKLKSLL